MRGVQLPDASLLRDAILGNEDAVDAPTPAEDGGSYNNIIIIIIIFINSTIS